MPQRYCGLADQITGLPRVSPRSARRHTHRPASHAHTRTHRPARPPRSPLPLKTGGVWNAPSSSPPLFLARPSIPSITQSCRACFIWPQTVVGRALYATENRTTHSLLVPPTDLQQLTLYEKQRQPVWPSGKALSWYTEGPRFDSALALLSLQTLWCVDNFVTLSVIINELIAAHRNAGVILVVTGIVSLRYSIRYSLPLINVLRRLNQHRP